MWELWFEPQISSSTTRRHHRSFPTSNKKATVRCFHRRLPRVWSRPASNVAPLRLGRFHRGSPPSRLVFSPEPEPSPPGLPRSHDPLPLSHDHHPRCAAPRTDPSPLSDVLPPNDDMDRDQNCDWLHTNPSYFQGGSRVPYTADLQTGGCYH